MHIVITLAGHSRRFKAAGYSKPKFLIEIDGKTMLERVIDMFDDQDHFHFVLNEEQAAEYPDLMEWLSRLSQHGSVTVIPAHEKGPVHTALQVTAIPAGEPVIVTYCDFIVSWNYARFRREIAGYDGAIPSFRGFHPASFGNTNYAYTRIDEHKHLIELREKKSFTDKRHEEYANAGIYYFKSWDTFSHYANRLMHDGFSGLKEGYVSLLANLMIADGLTIKITDVDRFICWGTPEDLEQYMFWSGYFMHNAKREGVRVAEPGNAARQVNLIPMAGKGSRFHKACYNVSKPLITIGANPMVVEACLSFPGADQWVFLPRAEDLDKHPIRTVLERLYGDNATVVPVDHDTSGQAATCLLGKHTLRPDDHLLIASCDYRTVYNHKTWAAIVNDPTIDAAVWTCRVGANLTKNPKAFAYCKTGPDGKTIKRMVEKDTISDTPQKDPLVVGTFWFRRAEDFVHVAEQAIRENIQVNGEHYVANSMNIMLEQGKRIVIFDIDQWISFGDPFELDIYYYWEDYFCADNKGHRGKPAICA